jgi:chromate transporter
MTDREFLDYLAITNLIPGPNSSEMVMHVGQARAGLYGMLLSGWCFILPAAVIVTILASVYVRTADAPQARWLMSGVAPVVIAIVVDALVALGRQALRTPVAWVAASLLAAAALSGMNELVLLFVAGVVFVILRLGTAREAQRLAQFLLVPASVASMGAVAAPGAASATPWLLGLFFLKVGSILFGSGYILIAYLQRDLVERWQWLTPKQLLDAIAVGQFTPGPLSTTATFIGYMLAGVPGAVLSTIGIFLPAFVFVALTHRAAAALRRSQLASAFLEGVTLAAVALMAAVTWNLARTALVDVVSLAIAGLAAVVLLAWRPNSAWLVLAGAAAGWVLGQ